MTPRLSIIAASLRKFFSAIGGDGDPYWDNVVLAMHMDSKSDPYWSKTSLALHMNQADPYWANTVLAMHMDTDPYVNQVVFGLHMDGADNGTVFSDVKGKVITLQGSTKTKTAIKKFGTASANFPGIGSGLSTPITTDFSLNPNIGFTVECWFYHVTDPGLDGANLKVATLFTIFGENSLSSCNLHIMGNSTIGGTGILLEYSVSGVTKSTTFYIGTIAKNTWYHVAISASAASTKYFLNGLLVHTSAPFETALPAGITGTVRIGRMYASGVYERPFIGYMDDLRITKGVARYSDSFSLPSKAFEDSLSPFIDEKGHSITAFGNAIITPSQSKFGGMSAYFDGVGDYLQLPTSTDYAFGTGDFTIELWVNIISLSTIFTIFDSRAAGYLNGFTLVVSQNGTLGSEYRSAAGAVLTSPGTSAGAVEIGSWYHIAHTRTGTTHRLFVNGIMLSEITETATYSFGNTSARIGWVFDSNTGYAANGYIDDLRITKGVSRYTKNFIVPATAFATTEIFPDEKGNTPVIIGSPTISALQSKFGGYSALFNGTTDGIYYTSSPLYGFSTKDFTLECWFKTGFSGTLFDLRLVDTDYGLFAINNGVLSIWNGLSFINCITTVSNDTWTHVAFVRIKSYLNIFINGILETIAYYPKDLGLTRPLRIGVSVAGSQFFNGYMDELRVTKDVARYKSEFTPPKYPFLEPGNKPLFLEETGKFVTVVGNANVSNTRTKFGDSSGYFNGVADYLQLADTSDFSFGVGDFTLEAWVYILSYSSFNPIFSVGDTGMGDWWFGLSISTGTLRLTVDTSDYESVAIVPLSVWTHVAMTRTNGVLKMFIDGVPVYSTALTTDLADTLAPRIARGRGTSPNYVEGYIDDLRITKGFSRYVTNFNPPITTFPNYKKSNTDKYFNQVVLGLHMDGLDNGVVFTEVKGKVATLTGNVCTKTAIKNVGSSSAYFDGAGDRLSFPASMDWDLGSNYTIEFWIYLNTMPSAGNSCRVLMIGVNGTASSFSCAITSDGQVAIGLAYAGDSISAPAGSVSVGKWIHIAFSVIADYGYGFINGILVSGPLHVTPQTPVATNLLYIGYDTVATVNHQLNGYLDEFRITKGVGRYNKSFTPLLMPFSEALPTNQEITDRYADNVVLGLHMNGLDNGVVFSEVKGKTITVSGNTCTKTATKKFGTASAYFDGTGDYLTVPASADWDLGTSDFTIECWVFINANSVADGNGFRGFVIASIDNGVDGSFEFIVGGTTTTTGTGIQIGSINPGTYQFTFHPMLMSQQAWHHIAAVRKDGVITSFVDGAKIGSSAFAHSLGSATGILHIGSRSLTNATFNLPLNGYMDDLRFTKGVARYAESFVVPSREFPDFNNFI